VKLRVEAHDGLLSIVVAKDLMEMDKNLFGRLKFVGYVYHA
jgi:hypothetical protein